MQIDNSGNLERFNTYNLDRNYTHDWSFYLTKIRNSGYILIGATFNDFFQRNASAISLTSNGVERWYSVYSFDNSSNHCFTSVVTGHDDYIIAAGWIEVNDRTSYNVLVMKLEPEVLQPYFIFYEPEDTVLTCLRGDTINFRVRTIDDQGDELSCLWICGEDTLSYDSTARKDFQEFGNFDVTCYVSDWEFTASITWHVTVTGMYIAAFTPDTLDLTVRRNSVVDFSVAVRTILEEPVNYAWTYIDRERQREEIGNEDSVTFRFDEGGDCWIEAAVWQGDFDDVVTWSVNVRSVNVRSLIWWYWPLETNLSVPVNTTVDFEVVPFVLGEDDMLRFNWWLDGERLDFDSTVSAVSVEFGELGEHKLTCVLTDTCDADTARWLVNVYDPRDAVIPPDDYLPQALTLYPPFPNPFNTSSTVRYDLPAPANIKLLVYDLSGRLVEKLADGEQPAGRHAVELDGSELAAGVYFIRLEPPLSPPLQSRGGNPTSCLIQKAVIVK